MILAMAKLKQTLFGDYQQHLDNLRRKSSAQRSGNSRVSVHLCNDSASNIEGSAYRPRCSPDMAVTSKLIVRSGWIIEQDSDTPRLTTCYPL